MWHRIHLFCLLAALSGIFPGALRAESAPRTHALIVAISQFTDPALAPYALHGAEQDAQLMEAAVPAFAGPDAQVRTLTGAGATLAAVEAEFDRLRTQAQPGDRIMLYFSAHGSRIPDTTPFDEADGEDEILLLADAGSWDGTKVPGALVDDHLAAAIRDLRGSGVDVFLVIDSCASGGASRSGGRRLVRNLSPALLSVPQRVRRSVQRHDDSWVEDDMPAGSGRLVTFAAGPTYAAAWDTPKGGLFTQSLAAALSERPTDFVALAQAEQRLRIASPLPRPASEIGGAIESPFFFAGAVRELVATARALPPPDWTLDLHAAARQGCDPDRIVAPRELDPSMRQRLGHCDAVMLTVSSEEPGYFDAWYVDSAGQRTLLSPIRGFYLDGRSPTHLSFTFVTRDPDTGAPFPPGTDRLLMLRQTFAGEHDAALIIEFEVPDEI